MSHVYKNVKRFMIGSEEETHSLIWVNTCALSDETSGTMQGDCSINISIGGKPICLHNDMNIDKPIESMQLYVKKLEILQSMVSEMVAKSQTHPNETFINREFLNPINLGDRLFGGAIQVMYSASHKMYTIDICDCSNKTRRSYNTKTMEEFMESWVTFIDSALEDLIVMDKKHFNGEIFKDQS